MRLLQLQPAGEQTLSIATFGAVRNRTTVCPIVCVCICLSEQLRSFQSHSLVSTEPNTDLESILDLTKFSALSRLIGVIAKVLRAVQRFRTLKKREGIDPLVDPVEESQRAELLWVKSARDKFSDLKTLTKQFNLFKEEKEVWHCGGRLANMDIPYAVKYPILLLKNSTSNQSHRETSA